MEIPEAHRSHVEGRLRSDLIAWLTTVRPSGMPDTVPIWFVWTDGVFVIYSQPGKPKLRNVAHQAQISLALDDTRGGDDVVRFEGTAEIVDDYPAADQVPDYVAKYSERIVELGYGDPANFAREFSVPVVVTPTRFRRWA